MSDRKLIKTMLERFRSVPVAVVRVQKAPMGRRFFPAITEQDLETGYLIEPERRLPAQHVNMEPARDLASETP